MHISDRVRGLLKKRGVETDAAIAAFLAPDFSAHTHDPFLLTSMDHAVARVLSAVERKERIAIYADFDCDGIPGAALLHDFFSKIAYNNIEIYLPHRDREGYGFHRGAIDELKTRGVSLIITVDVGTTALDSVRHASDIGIDCVLTDHHEITGELPDAIALLNPKRGAYPFADLCGAAVAFKLVQALIAEGKRKHPDRFRAITPGWEKWLLDMVAIATVADMVPLVDENRVLAYWGITVLRKSGRPGIRALCNRLRLRQAELTEEDIGFSIAPRINAASRMDEPDLAFKLLTTRDYSEAEILAAHLEELNASRKGVVSAIVREARKRVRERYAENEAIVVLGNPEWKPSLLGLAANSLVGDRGGVVCLWGRDALGRIKGSCRSDGSFSVVELFSGASHAFEEFGGHRASGGFTVATEHVHTLPDVLAKAARTVSKRDIARADAHDALITVNEMDTPLFREISVLAPFGVGNPKPIFRLTRLKISSMRRFGKEGNHIEMSLLCTETGKEARAFDFFRTPDDFTLAPHADTEAAVLGTVERDSFRGGFALRLVDVLPAA
ncbi:single-stranded-DNA-specific exonuclease RecJ [Candidatus Kaiserbacteria bacterium]|nr:single-stranded-DNA-specific exonuclease RecJ [Candidatus Kaiserbacteria bacterium]